MPSALVRMLNRSPRALRRPLHRPGHPDQAVDDLHHPLAERVVLGQAPGQQDVGQADGDVGHHQAAEHPQRPPPGARVAFGVELVPEVEQRDEQHERDDGGGDPHRVEEVDGDVEREQAGHRLPGAPLPAAQAVREHQQHQPDEHVRAAGDVGQRPRDQVVDPVQPVHQVGPQDVEDVGQADEEGQQRRHAGHPAALVRTNPRRLLAAGRGLVRPVRVVAGGHLGSFPIRP